MSRQPYYNKNYNLDVPSKKKVVTRQNQKVFLSIPGADPGFCEGGFEGGFVNSLKGTFEQK